MIKNLSKISIIGAGNVGATAAFMIAQERLGNVVLIDVAGNIAKAKALDMSHALAARALNNHVTAGESYKDISDSNIVVVTAGFPRKPGMSRDDLLKANADVISGVAKEIKKYAPGAIVIVVTNPLDVMTYLTYKVTGFSHSKVFGMAGVLDSARLADYIAKKLKAKRSDIKALVLGSHGDLMVPSFAYTKLNGKPLSELLSEKDLQELSELTKNSGAEIVSLLGTGSAYYGPAASVFEMVKAILKDDKTTHCVCAYLHGAYGLKDVYLGVPCVLGKKGIERVVELKLAQKELDMLHGASKTVKEMISKLNIE